MNPSSKKHFMPITSVLKHCWVLLMMALLLLIIAGCSKSEAPAKDNEIVDEIVGVEEDTPGNIKGMGNSTASLQGTPFKFTSTVEIEGGLKGWEFDLQHEGFCQVNGSGIVVLISMELVSKLDKDTVLVLPAGLTFVADDINDQNGILLQKVTIALAARQRCRTLLYAFCLNASRKGSSKSSRYQFGPITNSGSMWELIDLVKNKKVNYADYSFEKYMENVGTFQNAVWLITDFDGINDDYRKKFNELPNK